MAGRPDQPVRSHRGAPGEWRRGEARRPPAPNPAFHRFRHRDVARFTRHELGRWRGGHWRHERHHGRLGWWWVLGNAWYFYPKPLYPYPDYVSEFAYPAAPYPGQVWYYCPDPPGYYPYVPQCRVPWQPVPYP